MHGAFDEASLRLAKALRRPPEHVEAALQEVGVDAPYLSRVLVEGDPQGAIDAVSRRLGVPSKDLVLALLRASGAEEDPRRLEAFLRSPEAGSDVHEEAVREFFSRRLPSLLSRAAAVSLVLGAALAAFAGLALARPDLFRALLVYAAAAFVGLASLLLLAASWRMHRTARALRKMAGSRPSTKR